MRYRHYKGGEYEVICLATNEADHVPVVVYKSLKFDEIWVRPSDSFFGFVEVNGERIDRFKRIKDDETHTG